MGPYDEIGFDSKHSAGATVGEVGGKEAYDYIDHLAAIQIENHFDYRLVLSLVILSPV